MTTHIEPTIIEREPIHLVGVYCIYEDDNEEAGWRAAEKAFFERYQEIQNRRDSLIFGLMYRPHKDHPEIPEDVRGVFLGVDVTDFEHIPTGMSVTHFSGGKYALVPCREGEVGLVEAMQYIHDTWMPEHGYRMGDACLTAGDEKEIAPPHTEWLHMKLEPLTVQEQAE